MVATLSTTFSPFQVSQPAPGYHALPFRRAAVLRTDSTIGGCVEALLRYDPDTFDHAQRVSTLATRLATALELSDAEITAIAWGALLHDVGKLWVPEQIINKPGALTHDEQAEMQQHPRYGYTLLQSMLPAGPMWQQVLDIVRHHHEKWDGNGYPDRLRGEQIGYAARICAVADVWDALRSARPYRPAWSFARTAAYLQAHAGTHFDPELVQVFLALPS